MTSLLFKLKCSCVSVIAFLPREYIIRFLFVLSGDKKIFSFCAKCPGLNLKIVDQRCPFYLKYSRF